MRISVSALLWSFIGLTFVGQAGAALTAPATLSTVNLRATSFTLKWTAATGATSGIAGYDVYRGGALLGSTTTARSFAVTVLSPTTTYSMTVVARDGAGGVSPPSAPLLVTTTADVTDPGRPTALAATAITTTSFALAWTAPADNVGVTGYNIYRATVLVGSSPTTSFALTGLAPDAVHRITVRALDLAGNLSAASAALTIRTLADPPSVPTALIVANLKAASFTFKWTASTGGTGGIANYDVWRDGVLAGTTTKKSFAFTSQTPLTTYSLTVAARDHEGRVSAPSAPLSVSTPADTTKPTVPKDLSAANVTHNAFTLTWTPSTDNVGVTGYDVLRNNVVIGSPASATFAVTGLAPLTTYSMRVKAKDAVGNISGASVILPVTTAETPNVAPTVTLTEPLTDSFFTLPFTLTLSAVAADSDGTIALAEFFSGTTLLGAGTLSSSNGSSSTFTLPFTFTAPGPHLLIVRATDNRNATTDSAPVALRLLPGLPYITDFEEAEGYVPGSLHDQLGWTVATGAAQVTSDDSSSGEQSVRLEPGATLALVDQEIGPGATNPSPVFVDVFVHPVAGATPGEGSVFDLDNARLAFVHNGTVGRFAVLDGDGSGAGTWKNLSTDFMIDTNHAASTWQRLTVRLDYTAKTWDFYLDGRLLAYDLKFRSSTATYLSGLSFQGHPAAASGVDDLYTGADNPLFADADHDGMDAAWETGHNLNPAVNDRNGDLDGDGLTNIAEYAFGSNPNAADTDADGLNDAQERTLGTNPTITDTDGDGLPDGWEQSHGLNPLSDADATLDTDGDSKTNLEEYAAGTDPADYYNGVAPVITVISGDNQTSPAGEFNIEPFIVGLQNATGDPLANAPVLFAVQSGGGQLALANTGNPVLADTLAQRTDATGKALAYYRQPGVAGQASVIVLSAGGAQASLSSASAASGPADSDHNGLPDDLEMQYFGRIGVNPTGDADNDGVSNLQEFQAGTDPTTPPFSATDTDSDGLPDAWEQRYFGTLEFGPTDQFNDMDRSLGGYYQQGLIPYWQRPAVTAGLRAWYVAGSLVFNDSATGTLTQWADLSGHGFHLRQTVTAAQPQDISSEDGQRFVYFTEGQSMATLSADILNGATDCTVLVTFRPDSPPVDSATALALGQTGVDGFRFGRVGAAGNDYAFTWPRAQGHALQGSTVAVPATLNTPGQITVVKSGTTQTLYVNGEPQATGSVAADLNALPGILTLGGAFSGAIFEVQLYDRALPPVERERAEDALLARASLQDADASGLPDRWERQHFGHIGVDPNADADGDGLSNQQEQQQATNPTTADSDGDGLPDGQEVALGTDPLDSSSKAPAQITWLSQVTTTTALGEHLEIPPGLQGLAGDSLKYYRRFHLQQTIVEDYPPDIPPSENTELGTRTMTATYNPDDPGNWTITGERTRLIPVDPAVTLTYPLDGFWRSIRPYIQTVPSQPALNGTVTESTARWTETGYYHPAYLSSVTIPYTVTVDLTLSQGTDAQWVDGGSVTSVAAWTPNPPTAGSSDGSSTQTAYHILVPAGTTGAIRWLEAFTPADGSAKQYTLKAWPIEGGATKSPPFTLSCPANGSSEVMFFDLPQLAVDANRDGQIKLAGEDAPDATSVANPYRFWLNDDIDSQTGNDSASAADLNPFSGTRNCDDEVINGMRDLEDFTRLKLFVGGIWQELLSGKLKIGLKWKNPNATTPSIRIWRNLSPNDGRDYLTDANTSRFQDANTAIAHLGKIEGANTYILSKYFWTESGLAASQPYGHLLFEGCTAGEGQLVITLHTEDGIEIGEGSGPWIVLKHFNELYEHWTCGDVDLRGAAIADTATHAFGGPFEYGPGFDGLSVPGATTYNDYVLFVHGWRMQPWERRAFAETAFKRMYHQGYKGKFGLFSWPTEWVDLDHAYIITTKNALSDPQHYDRSEVVARKSGAVPLHELLVRLNGRFGTNHLHVFAHSMGNVVVSEALRSQPANTPLINRYIACQSAEVAHTYDQDVAPNSDPSAIPDLYRYNPPNPRTTPQQRSEGDNYHRGLALRANNRFVSFANLNDQALGKWDLNQLLKPDDGWLPSDTAYRYVFTPGNLVDTYKEDPPGLTGADQEHDIFWPADRFKILAHIVPARSRAAGASAALGGEFDPAAEINLDSPLYQFGGGDYSHSAQFLSNFAERRAFYFQLLFTFDLQPDLLTDP